MLVLLLFVIPVTSAYQSIDILSVSQEGQGEGGVATAHVNSRLGTGSVYIDSFPLTRLDTQLSARFARNYACDIAETDCSQLDFFYTIRAGTTIIGGPSAGAALTVLTYANLMDASIDRSTTITGTITGGGLVGPVGGIEQKVTAARNQGFSRVLIPASELSAAQNVSGIEIIGISTVEEAIWYFTGITVDLPGDEIIVPQAYSRQMEDVSVQLCDRSESLSRQASNVTEQVDTWLISAAQAAAQNKFYSAASFCFSANLALQRDILSNRSSDQLESIVRTLRSDIIAFDADLPDEFATIGDLEVFMVVRERLVESSDILDRQDPSNYSSSDIALALERYSSAVAWSSFFGILHGEQRFDETWIAQSCSQHISASQEQINYVTYLLSIDMDDANMKLRNAREYQRQEEWALCLYTAAKVQAEAQSVITVAYSSNVLNQTVDQKHARAQQLLARSSADDSFPIMSYAYYEYAGEVDDVFSKNLYSEYSIALSSLDIYSESPSQRILVDTDRLFLLVSGFLVGVLSGVVLYGAYSTYSRKDK